MAATGPTGAGLMGPTGALGPTGAAGGTGGTPSDVPNTLVQRDDAGSFAANMVSVDGNLDLTAAQGSSTAGSIYPRGRFPASFRRRRRRSS